MRLKVKEVEPTSGFVVELSSKERNGKESGCGVRQERELGVKMAREIGEGERRRR